MDRLVAHGTYPDSFVAPPLFFPPPRFFLFPFPRLFLLPLPRCLLFPAPRFLLLALPRGFLFPAPRFFLLLLPARFFCPPPLLGLGGAFPLFLFACAPLPFYIYEFSKYAPGSDEIRMAWAAAFVLVLVVFLLNVGARLIAGKRVVAAARAD